MQLAYTAHARDMLTERSGRVLRVVVGAKASSVIVVTVFFDRRLRRKS